MEGGTVQFLVFLLIIILIKESIASAASLDASPRTLKKSGDKIKVSWTDLDSPSKFDWLGIYTPPDADHNFFIGYMLLSSCIGWESGSCEFEIPLVNMRTAYQIRLFRGLEINVTANTPVDQDGDALPSTEHKLAVSYDIAFENYNEPTQVHLAMTSNPTEMRVMFVTRDPIKSFVKYGRKDNSLDFTTTTRSETYTRADMCDGPANSSTGWRDPGIIHDAVMKKLDRGERYFYQVGSDQGGWSEIYSFVLPEEDSDETHAILFGDMGTWAPYKTFLWLQQESERTIQLIQRDLKEEFEEKAVFISHIGDISYARGYAWLWDEFFHRIQPVAANAPYHVCIGNHEYDWPLQPWKPEWAAHVYGTDGGGECGVPYSMRFHMPGNSSVATGTRSPATRNLYYSLSIGVVHFLYISTETNFLPGSDQYAFIENDLKSVDRKKTPFVVLLGHRPMYTTNIDKKAKAMREIMIEYLETLAVRYNVNLMLWGHVHKYERTCAIQNHSCADPSAYPQPPVNVVIGMGGQDWQTSWDPRPEHPDSPIYPQPEWSLFRSGEFGYVRLHATKSILTMTYIGNHDGKIHDTLVLHSHEYDDDFFCSYGSFLWTLLRLFAVFFIGICIGTTIATFVQRKRKRSVNAPPSGSYISVKTTDLEM